jgi:hypothetical protein
MTAEILLILGFLGSCLLAWLLGREVEGRSVRREARYRRNITLLTHILNQTGVEVTPSMVEPQYDLLMQSVRKGRGEAERKAGYHLPEGETEFLERIARHCDDEGGL